MDVTSVNNVKIYNLGSGKSLPDWLTERKRRALNKKDSRVRHRIELIQEFEMPTVTTSLKLTKDEQFVLACGVYKPRVRCFEVSQLSMKFERCLDYEVTAFETLCDDYSKMVFLSSERYVEFHAKYGRYHRIRIPRAGRDMMYNSFTAELMFAGDSNEVYRLNLDQGQFLKSLETMGSSVNCIQKHDDHNLLLFGTQEGTVEAWDPRVRERVGMLQAGVEVFSEDMKQIPSVTKVAFRDALSIGVGTSSGHVMLYDLRSNKPLMVKDHMNSMPIKAINFHDEKRIIAADAKAVKIYDETGKIFTSICTVHDINDMQVFGRTGLIFVATESPKITPYYIPALGMAPRWCGFLDNITEELQETNQDTIYDDYKFVSVQELEDLNLTGLIGTSMLRAYMHGYFIDSRLYTKAKELSQPFAYEEYKKKKIKEKIEAMRADRMVHKETLDLPQVNSRVAQRILERERELQESQDKRKMKKFVNPMKDDRFSSMFENDDFEVDETTDDYNRLRSVISSLQKKSEDKSQSVKAVSYKMDDKDVDLSDDKSDLEGYESADEEEEEGVEEVPAAKRVKPDLDKDGFKVTSTEQSLKQMKIKQRKTKLSLAERLSSGDTPVVQNRGLVSGNRMMMYESKAGKKSKKENGAKEHMQERRQVRRSTKGLKYGKDM